MARSNTGSCDHLQKIRRTYRLLPTLVVSIGFLVLVSVGSVLIVNWIVDRRIVSEYTSRLIARDLGAEERALREHLDAAVHQGDFIAAAISDGRFRFGEPALADFLTGTLAAAPQVYGLIVCDPRGQGLHLLRGANPTEFTVENFDVAGDQQFAAYAAQIRTHKRPYWGAPVYRVAWQETFLNYFVPIWNGDVYVGFAALGITTRALSTLAKD
jgi:adenylate cyclase